MRAFDPTGSAALGYSPFVLDLVVNLAVMLTIVAAVRAVGTVLVVAFIVTPAAAARLVSTRVPVMMVVAAGARRPRRLARPGRQLQGLGRPRLAAGVGGHHRARHHRSGSSSPPACGPRRRIAGRRRAAA